MREHTAPALGLACPIGRTNKVNTVQRTAWRPGLGCSWQHGMVSSVPGHRCVDTEMKVRVPVLPLQWPTQIDIQGNAHT
jgi:hypothetical protein